MTLKTCTPSRLKQITVPQSLKGTRAALFYLLRELEKPIRDTRISLKTTFSPPAAQQPEPKNTVAPVAVGSVMVVGDEFVFG